MSDWGIIICFGPETRKSSLFLSSEWPIARSIWSSWGSGGKCQMNRHLCALARASINLPPVKSSAMDAAYVYTRTRVQRTCREDRCCIVHEWDILDASIFCWPTPRVSSLRTTLHCWEFWSSDTGSHACAVVVLELFKVQTYDTRVSNDDPTQNHTFRGSPRSSSSMQRQLDQCPCWLGTDTRRWSSLSFGRRPSPDAHARPGSLSSTLWQSTNIIEHQATPHISWCLLFLKKEIRDQISLN
jgi:hypothetical protein